MAKRTKNHTDQIKALGKRIAKIRRSKGFSQTDLGAETNMDPAAIRRIEGGRTNPTFATLLLLADALEMSVSELVNI